MFVMTNPPCPTPLSPPSPWSFLSFFVIFFFFCIKEIIRNSQKKFWGQSECSQKVVRIQSEPSQNAVRMQQKCSQNALLLAREDLTRMPSECSQNVVISNQNVARNSQNIAKIQLSLVVIGNHWQSLVVIGSHWRSTEVNQIDQNSSSMERLSSQLYVGMGLGWDGWLSQVVGCLRSRHLPSLTFIVKNAEICIVASGALLGLQHFKY